MENMTEEKAFNDVKELLVKNGIEFKEGIFERTITAKAGKIIQWFHFTKNSFSVASAVIIDKRRIETSTINKYYEKITGFCFVKGDLWIREKGLGYTILALKKD